MSKRDARFIAFDANYLKDDGVAGQHNLQVFLNATGALEADASGINVADGGITNDMLAGSITFDKLPSNLTRDDQAETITAEWTFSTIPQMSSTPDSDYDLVNKAYVDSVASGLDAKDSVRCSTTEALTGTGLAYAANQITWTATNGPTSIDGVSLNNGDRILVRHETDGAGTLNAEHNGIYVRTNQDQWDRAPDLDTWGEHVSAFTFVEEGTNNADNGYVCTADQGGTLGTTDIFWVQFSGAGQVTAGAGLTKDGNTLNVGQNSTGAITVNANDIAISVDGSTIGVSGTDPGSLYIPNGGVTETQLNASVAGDGLTGGAGSPIAVATTSTGALTIAANSVAVSVDGSTIGVSGTGPGQLYVPNGGITGTQLNASVAGAGLTGGAGSPLAVGAGNGISVAADSVAVNPAQLITGGNAEIDGDQLDIDWNPTNYTPDTTPTEASNVDHLTAHLYGIDQALVGKHKTKKTVVTIDAAIITSNLLQLDHDKTEVVTPYSDHVRVFVDAGGWQEYGVDFTVTTDDPSANDVAVDVDTFNLDPQTGSTPLEVGDVVTIYYDIIG